MATDELYAGFNDYNDALDAQDVEDDDTFAAAAKSSYGNRPPKVCYDVFYPLLSHGRLSFFFGLLSVQCTAIRERNFILVLYITPSSSLFEALSLSLSHVAYTQARHSDPHSCAQSTHLYILSCA